MSAQFNIKAADPAAVSRIERGLGLPRFVAATLLARGDGVPVRKGPGHGRDDLLAVIALHAPVPLHYVHGVSRLSPLCLSSGGR